MFVGKHGFQGAVSLGKKKRLVSALGGIAAQGGENVFRLFARYFEIEGIRAKINLVPPGELAE